MVDVKLLNGTVEMMMLDVISASPTYGYAIVQTVFARSNSQFELKEGSLYPALHRLERQNYLESYWVEQEGRRRKYYKLTAAGKKALAERRKEWKVFSAGVNGVLGLDFGLT